MRNLFSILNYIFHVISELGEPHDSSASHNINSLLSSFHQKQLTRHANKNMPLLTMLNKVCNQSFVVSRAGEHERSHLILVLHLCICTCSECNATDDTTRHPLHVHCYSYEEDLKRHTVLSRVSQSTTHYKSHYNYTQHTSALLNNMHISCIVQSEVECSSMHTTTLTHTQQSQWAHTVIHYKIDSTSQMSNTFNRCINNSKQ